MLYVRLVGSLGWRPLVHQVGHEIVAAAPLVLFPHLGSQEVAELDGLNGEVDDGGILLHVKGVLGEALDVEDDVGRQSDELELLEEVVLVRLVLLLSLTVELGKDVKEGHLGTRQY